MLRRSWVWVPALYTGWIFFTFICCKNCCLFEKTKINQKEAEDGPSKEAFCYLNAREFFWKFWPSEASYKNLLALDKSIELVNIIQFENGIFTSFYSVNFVSSRTTCMAEIQRALPTCLPTFRRIFFKWPKKFHLKTSEKVSSDRLHNNSSLKCIHWLMNEMKSHFYATFKNKLFLTVLLNRTIVTQFHLALWL